MLLTALRQASTLAVIRMTRFIFTICFCLFLIACSGRQTILIDGTVHSKQEFDKLDSSEIFSYSKWLPGKAPPWYDKWNKTTLIVVKTKRTERKLQKDRYALLNQLLDSVDKGTDILIVEDGILVPTLSQKKLRKLLPDQLSNAKTMEWQDAKKLYGSVARPITLIINTYDPKYNYVP
jgi:hypothetical protein